MDERVRDAPDIRGVGVAHGRYVDQHEEEDRACEFRVKQARPVLVPLLLNHLVDEAESENFLAIVVYQDLENRVNTLFGLGILVKADIPQPVDAPFDQEILSFLVALVLRRCLQRIFGCVTLRVDCRVRRRWKQPCQR